MARIMRDYRCDDCSAVTEHWASTEEVASLTCSSCGTSALTVMIAAPMLGFTNSVANGEASSDGMTSSIDRWDRARAHKLKIEQRNLERHGTYD